MDTQSYQVLILDDDSFFLELVENSLHNIGLEHIYKSENGQAALQLIDNPEQTINLILCDLNMPEMDGIEFIRHLATRKFGGDIILLSGEDKKVLDISENLAREHQLNILGILEKPLEHEKLLNLIRNKKDRPTTRKQADSDKIELSKKDLLSALENEEIILFYQPKVDIKTKKVVGFESLARWNHPAFGILPPDLFINLAEKNGLINQLTRQVISMAVKQRAGWGALNPNVKISINLSVYDLSQLDLPEYIESLVKTNNLSASQFILEITESKLIEKLSTVLDVITRLSLKRFSLSIDDFGTGYSSFIQLQQIPFSELKIDRAFVFDAYKKPSAKSILESSIELANKLNIETIAEGVESQADWDTVEAAGCDLIQGYFVAKPLPPDQVLDWVTRWESK
ncbi:MAG: hypothetical protein COB66_05915 [Coxiella sp. (in: Bacteria)]|nr:MAG: hypothetical protein COB66_05915 [Coxiella sp. (in: g-proteobacteria)]